MLGICFALGQETKILPKAKHTASTVEMLDFQKQYDVAVIDEIQVTDFFFALLTVVTKQLLGDRARGFAWTRALQGLAASELHLCGDPSALRLVRKICRRMNEDVEVREYERFSPLEVDDKTFSGYQDVKPGDCIVAFSRSKIFMIKQVCFSLDHFQ